LPALEFIDSHEQLMGEAYTSTSIDMADVLDSFNARQKYSHFRILVIGRANAGKTTLLKRVCNTTKDPRIYNEEKNLALPIRLSKRHSFHIRGKPAGADVSGDSLIYVAH
jgi:septin family protein